MYAASKALIAYNPRLLVFGLAGCAALWAALLPATTSSAVAAWWIGLCLLTLFNIAMWRLSAASLEERRETIDPQEYLFRRRLVLLAAVYVFGCGFRSILPRADVQRIGLVDSWLSSVMVGRSVATVAEICFVVQWALILYVLARAAGSRLGVSCALVLVPIIVIAEICSWYAVVTTSYLGNVIEESLWAASVSLVLVSCLTLWPRSDAAWRWVLPGVLLLGSAYVAFMCTVDVPMYAQRWLQDQAAGREYLSASQGIADVWARRHITFDWEHWQDEVPWMTLYFSVAVWCSIALCHAPVRLGTEVPGNARLPQS